MTSSLTSLLPASSHELQPTAGSWYGKRMPADARELPFAEQLLAHVDALYNFARQLTRANDAAEELVQEAFVRALGAQASFVPGGNQKAWLFRILHNAFVDRLRRAGQGALELHDDTLDARGDDGELWLRGDLEIERLRRLVADDIRAALAELSLEARTVILLDVEGFTEGEIARVMDSATGTVKSRLMRARAKLRVLLKDYAR